jgi:hypothetical protein
MDSTEPHHLEQQTFRFPKSIKWFCLIGVLFFWGMAFLGLALPYIQPSKNTYEWILGPVLAVVFIPLGWYCFKVWRKCDAYVRVSETEITYLSPHGEQISLHWRDLFALKERVLLQRLELYDTRGQKVMNLEYQLEDFDRLIQLIQRDAPQLREKHVIYKVFHRHGYVRSMLLGSCIFFAIFGLFILYKSNTLMGLVFLVFAALSLATSLREISRVTVGQTETTLTYPLWERKVPYGQIVDITLKTVIGGQGNVSITVIIKRYKGKDIKLSMIKEGSLVLFDALQAAWESGKSIDSRPNDYGG